MEAHMKSCHEVLVNWRTLLKERYSTRKVVVILTILFLSLADAFFTILIIKNGGIELNPIMALAIEKGIFAFLLSKYLLTSVGLLILCVLSYIKLARHALVTFLLFYMVLFVCHLSTFYLTYSWLAR